MTGSHRVIPDVAAAGAARWATHSDPVTARLGRSALARATDLLGEAHRHLQPGELAELLLAVGVLIEPMRRGAPLDAPPSGLASASEVTPAAGVYLRPVHVLLEGRTRTAHPDARRRLAASVADLADDLAALPRGCAVPGIGVAPA
jgi:hypothetical protein